MHFRLGRKCPQQPPLAQDRAGKVGLPVHFVGRSYILLVLAVRGRKPPTGLIIFFWLPLLEKDQGVPWQKGRQIQHFLNYERVRDKKKSK